MKSWKPCSHCCACGHGPTEGIYTPMCASLNVCAEEVEAKDHKYCRPSDVSSDTQTECLTLCTTRERTRTRTLPREFYEFKLRTCIVLVEKRKRDNFHHKNSSNRNIYDVKRHSNLQVKRCAEYGHHATSTRTPTSAQLQHHSPQRNRVASEPFRVP